MAAANTYTPIATYTVTGSAVSSITFSSLGSYTDIVLVLSGRSGVAANTDGVAIRVNSDSGSNYSMTEMYGNGSGTTSTRYSNDTYFRIHPYAETGSTSAANTFGATTIQFMNYGNTTTYKTILARTNNTDAGTAAIVSMWRNTAAITSIALLAYSGDFQVGTTVNLYGILAA